MSTEETNLKELSALQRAVVLIEKIKKKLSQQEYSLREPIAIIGIGCRLPGGSNNPKQFWELLSNGVDAVQEIPDVRWEKDAYYDSDPETPGKMYTRCGGFIPEVDKFDPKFFNISPREALTIDPQHRLLLEVSWEAFESAGIIPQRLDSTPVGVFVGITLNEYDKIIQQAAARNLEHYGVTGVLLNVAAGRISYTFGLTGPCMSIDTACSSSLVAIHQACQSLRLKECQMALAGGVNLILLPESMIITSKAKMLSVDGRCKTFDATADGMGRGEGCGMLLLKRLSDAQADGDNILAVIRGSAVNQDGASSGLTVPNGFSQEQLIRQALKMAKLEPSDVSYVEAHGTGTPLGDPIELRALGRVFAKDPAREKSLIVGSVKTNIGHLEAAAGVSGVIKVILQLQHKQIVPHLHLKSPTPNFNWQEYPLVVPTQLTPWEVTKGRRIAGVSSFGVSGTNANLILEAAPSQVKSADTQRRRQAQGNSRQDSEGDLERSLHLLTLSAKTETALSELVIRYQNYLEKLNSEAGVVETIKLADICYTANTGRAHFQYRLAAIASNQQELLQKLSSCATKNEVAGVFSGLLSSTINSPKIAFLFTGQGSQYLNMGKQLYQQAPVFRQALNECDEILSSILEHSLLSIIYPKDNQETSLLDQTAYTQPALFAIEYALAKLWESWGIKPNIVMGHSVGEYVAATVAGVWSLEAGLKLIATRGRLMQQLPASGEMIAVMASELKVSQLLTAYRDKVAIAAINGSESTVISGESVTVRAIASRLESEGIKTKQLQVSHAFHSPLMEPMLAEFEAVANQISFNQPTIPIMSNVTGAKADNSIATAQYWVNHVRQPVRFAQAMAALHTQGYEIFLEIGPKPILLGIGRQCLPENVGIWLPSLRPSQIPLPTPLRKERGVEGIPLERGKPDDTELFSSDWQQMLSSLGQLYVKGAKVDWLEFYRDDRHQKVVLPTYPFQRQRYWVESKGDRQNVFGKPQLVKDIHPLLGNRINFAGQQVVFESFVGLEYPTYLSDHKVFDKVLFPATAYLEMAVAAAINTFTSLQVMVTNVVIARGFILPEKEVKTIQTILTPIANDRCKLEIFSSSEAKNQELSEWILHTEGEINAGSTAEIKIDLEKYQRECTQAIEIKQHYQQYQEKGINYGSSFQGIKQLWKGEGTALAEIALPETLTAQATEYYLHPALLDVATQIILHAIDKTETGHTYLPVSIKKLKVHRHPGSTAWAIAQIPDTNLTANIKLVDNQGNILVEIDGFRVIGTTASSLLNSLQPKSGHWYYQINWQSRPLKANIPLTEPRNWLLFVPKGIWAEQLTTALVELGQQFICVSTGEDFQQLGENNYQVCPTQPESFRQLLQAIFKEKLFSTGVVHLWSLDSNLEELTESLQSSCASVLHLLQGLILEWGVQMPSLWLVTQGSQNLGTEAELQIQQSPLWGLGRVIALEYPELHCRMLDLDLNSPEVTSVQTLVRELLSADSENQIAYRQEQRQVARLIPLPSMTPQTETVVQSNASYLITGGLGAIGLQVAQWLSQQGATSLVLMGRQEPSKVAQAAIDNFEQAGVKVFIPQGDVANKQDLELIINHIDSQLPSLRGVFHAAGVLDDGMLQSQTWQRFENVMAAKVLGSWHLHHLTQHRHLDFFVCFSSVASLLGSPGQGNYATANAFMDGLAHYRRSQGLPGLSINWGPWAKGGMAAQLEKQHQGHWQNLGLQSIGSNEGIQALAELLQQDLPQVGVIPVNWSQLLAKMPRGVNFPILEDLAISQEKPPQQESLIQQLEALPNQQLRQLLENQIRLQVAQVLGLPETEQIDSQAGLFELGLDSLMVSELRNLLQSSLGCSLSATALFNYNNIDDLVDYVAQQLSLVLTEAVSTEESRPQEIKEESLTSYNETLDNLSEAELAELLKQTLTEIQKM